MFNCIRMVQPGTFLLSIHAKPNARSSSFSTPLIATDEDLEVRIGAPPVEGASNAELVSFLEESLETARRRWLQALELRNGTTTSDAKDDNWRTTKVTKGKAAPQQLPERIKVTLQTGKTSKSKVLTLEIPCETLEGAWSLLLEAAKE